MKRTTTSQPCAHLSNGGFVRMVSDKLQRINIKRYIAMKHCASFLFTLLLTAVLGTGNLSAQTKYPVSITNFNVTPSVFLSDYTTPGAGRLKATLRFSDYNEADVKVYLKLTVESDNVKLETSPSFRPTEAVTLIPGEPQVIMDEDFTPYFLFHNLQCQGITQAELQRTDCLPEGWYTFTITAVEANSGKALSLPASVRAHLSLIDPPMLVTPARGDFIKTNLPQIPFRWQQSKLTVSAGFQTAYYLRLYEIPDGGDPLTAMQDKSAREVAMTDVIAGTSYNYGVSDFPLTPGKRYAYTITAQASDGRQWFKNGGMSEIGWFYYGYPTGGNIKLLYPKNEEALNRKMMQKLEWAANDNLVDNNQPVVYSVITVELESGEDPQQAISRPDAHETKTIEIFNKSGYNVSLANLGSERRYAWQVKAYTEEVEVGVSAVQTFYSSLRLEEFVAAFGHIVEITSLDNAKVDDLSGKGRVKISDSGEKIDVHFEHLKIVEDNDGLANMVGGEIKCSITGLMKPVPLSPSRNVNGKAICYPDSIRIDHNGMYIKGRIEWDYPFGTTDKEKSKVKFQPTWFNFNTDYKLMGMPQVESDQSYTLLEPANFFMKIDNESYAYILKDSWEMIFSGQIFVNENVKGTQREYYSIDFCDWRELHYNTIVNYENENEIRLIANTKLNLIPRTVIVDLSEELSPSKFADNMEWKGIYFENFDMRFTPKVDDRGQINLTREVLNNHTLSVADTCRSWIAGDGLQFCFATQIAEEGIVMFNTFPSKIDLLNIDIQKSAVRKAELKGSIRIPVVSQTDRYAYSVPITNSGFQTGYLDKSLDGLKFVFNEKNPDLKLQATVKRAIFAGQNRLDMDLELKWDKINVTFSDLQQFCAWGNYQIGFVQPKGVANLTHQTQGIVDDYKINVEQLGCGRMCNQYAFAVSASVVIDEDIAGAKGAPKLNFYSIADNVLLTDNCNLAQQNIQTEQRFLNQGNFPMTDEGVGEPDDDKTEEEIEAINAARTAEVNALENAYQNAQTVVANINYSMEKVGTFSSPLADYMESKVSDIQQISHDGFTIGSMIELLKVLRSIMSELDEQAAVVLQTKPQLQTACARIDGYIILLEDVNTQVATFERLVEDFRSGAIFEWVANQLTDKMMAKISEPILKAGATAKEFIVQQVTTVQNAVLKESDQWLEEGFTKVLATTSGITKGSKVVEGVVTTAKSGLKQEIRKSVELSVQTNFIAYFTNVIDTITQARVLGFLSNEIRTNLMKLVKGDIKKISVQDIAGNAENTLSGIGNDVKKMVDFDNLSAMMANTGKDIINNIKWDKIIADILINVASSEVLNTLREKGTAMAQAIVGNLAEGVLSGVLDNVDINFDALKSGDFKNVIKFDPTHIQIDSKVFQGEGYAKKLKNDPVYGDAFMAEINAKIKMPKDFNVFAKFISGKQLEDNFDYWFVEFGCRNLGLPMTPVPLMFDGGAGRVYKHMSRLNDKSPYVPDQKNKFGAGIKAYFCDQAGGGVAVFDVDFEMLIEQEGFRLKMIGNVALGNTMVDGDVKKSTATGYGEMGYSNIDNIFYAKASVQLQAEPLICAGGEFNALITPDEWEISVGTRENPLYAKILCKDFIKIEAWMMVSNTMLDVGLHMLVDVDARTPTVNLGFIKFNAYAKLHYEFGAEVVVYWKPLKLKDAAIYMDLSVAVGVGYDLPWPLGSGDLDVLGVGLGGHLIYRSRSAAEMTAALGTDKQIANYTGEYSVLSGRLYGNVTVVGFTISLDMEAKKEWLG